jgi:hypothetical protein
VSLGGTGTVPGASLNPTNLAFGNQMVNTVSTSRSVTLTNSGTGPLTISSITITGTNSGDFVQTNTCPGSSATLAAGSACTISVTFTPRATGARAATLSVVDNAAGSPHSVAVSGTGVTPVATVSQTALTFASQSVNTTSPAQTVTLTNSGTAPLTITAIAISGTNASNFAQTNTCPVNPNTLAINATCTITVTFQPSASGTRTASLTVSDNAPGSPQAVSLTGTGTLAAVTLSTTSLGFASTQVGGTNTKSVTLTNSGTAALSIYSIGITGANAGDFTQTNNCPINPNTLAAKARCTITLTFKPTARGTRTATLSISDSASGAPHTVALSGNGK